MEMLRLVVDTIGASDVRGDEMENENGGYVAVVAAGIAPSRCGLERASVPSYNSFLLARIYIESAVWCRRKQLKKSISAVYCQNSPFGCHTELFSRSCLGEFTVTLK